MRPGVEPIYGATLRLDPLPMSPNREDLRIFEETESNIPGIRWLNDQHALTDPRDEDNDVQ